MKAYILNIEFVGSEPFIWRKVIMPADATFNRLHDVIQTVTNFKSGYPYPGYHLFEFDLGDFLLTNNLGILDEQDPRGRYSPVGTKIDAYLEEFGEVKYLYDFGDGWEFVVKLEDTVDDYYFGYPTLLDGAEAAPPEDVGGLYGFEDFLEAYEDEDHPAHVDAKAWGESMEFEYYHPEDINKRLKAIRYQKTQWDKIDHKNYKVINDKYRKSE